MGKSDTTEIIIETAKALPGAINLLSELLSWIGMLALADKSSDNTGSETGGATQSQAQAATISQDIQTFQELSTDCKNKTYSHFLQQFQYVYIGTASDPPQRLPDGSGKLEANEDFYNVQANNLAAVGTMINSSLSGTVPPWAQSQLANDLSARISVILGASPTNAFMEKAFTWVKNDPQNADKTYQADICWVYCTTLAPDPVNPQGQNVNTMFLYSIGTIYPAQNWLDRKGRTGVPVVRIAFAYTTMVIGTAVAAFIYAAKDKPADINVVVATGNSHGSITISTKQQPKFDDDGTPIIPYQWAIDALKVAGVKQSSIDFGISTTSESAEFDYLNQWEASEN